MARIKEIKELLFHLRKHQDGLDRVCGGVAYLVSFFGKRINCQCLDEKKKEMKIEKKVGFCACCLAEHEVTSLHLCSGCRFTQYCGAECQKADWADHKEECKQMSRNINSQPPI